MATQKENTTPSLTPSADSQIWADTPDYMRQKSGTAMATQKENTTPSLTPSETTSAVPAKTDAVKTDAVKTDAVKTESSGVNENPVEDAFRSKMDIETAAKFKERGRLKDGDFYRMMNNYENVKDAEYKAREDKRHKRAAMWSAIGDGLAAMSNLYFTTKDAPDQNLKPTMSESERERHEKFDKEWSAERAARLKNYREDMMNARKAELAQRKADQDAQIAAAKELRAQEQSKVSIALERAKVAKTEAERKKALADADKAQKAAEGYNRELNSRINRNNASAYRSYHGSSGKSYYLTNPYTNETEYYDNAAMYKNKYDEYYPRESTSTSEKTGIGGVKESSTTTTTKSSRKNLSSSTDGTSSSGGGSAKSKISIH